MPAGNDEHSEVHHEVLNRVNHPEVTARRPAGEYRWRLLAILCEEDGNHQRVQAHQVASDESDDPEAGSQQPLLTNGRRRNFPDKFTRGLNHLPHAVVDENNDVNVAQSIPVEVNHAKGGRRKQERGCGVLCDLVDVRRVGE